MNIKEFAKMLDGREYLEEITKEDEKLAKELGFVVVFGGSDDLVEFRGAIYGEADAWGGTEIFLKDGKFCVETGDACCDCHLWKKYTKDSKKIKVRWCKDEFAWTYETEIPHETFNIYDDGETYCRGIVFDYKEVV